MAPRFKKDMFWCWKDRDKEKARGLMGFNSYQKLFKFRDKFILDFSKKESLFVIKQEGNPTSVDSVFRLFRKENKEEVQKIFNKKTPNLFSSIFKTTYYRSWEEERNSIIKLAKGELETSHDFPCLIISTTICSPEKLRVKIKEIANELSIELHENKELENIDNVIMSNHTFDV